MAPSSLAVRRRVRASRGASGKPECWPALSSPQDTLAAGQPSDWQCRAGTRYLYVCARTGEEHRGQLRRRQVLAAHLPSFPDPAAVR